MIGPKVSVIMATYNHAPFVAEAIDSVLSQQGVEFEFLIADDGSSDTTSEVVSRFQDRRIKFSAHTINRGACVVTNELIEKSRGEYIALINSDDAWVKDKLRYQVEVLNNNPRIGASFGRVAFFDRVGRSIEKRTLPFGTVFDQENRISALWLRRFFSTGNCLCHPTILIRKSCYDRVGLYSNRFRQLPDFDMWIRLVKHYELHISERDLIKFRILPGENASSQTTVNSIRTINEHYLIADTFFDGVDRLQLIQGFEDLLTVKNVPTEQHLEIEKSLLFFTNNQWLGRPYQIIGLIRMNHLLSSPAHQQVLLDSYGIDDQWFQRAMGEVDVFRPKMVAAVQYSKTVVQEAVSRLMRWPGRKS